MIILRDCRMCDGAGSGLAAAARAELLPLGLAACPVSVAGILPSEDAGRTDRETAGQECGGDTDSHSCHEHGFDCLLDQMGGLHGNQAAFAGSGHAGSGRRAKERCGQG